MVRHLEEEFKPFEWNNVIIWKMLTGVFSRKQFDAIENLEKDLQCHQVLVYFATSLGEDILLEYGINRPLANSQFCFPSIAYIQLLQNQANQFRNNIEKWYQATEDADLYLKKQEEMYDLLLQKLMPHMKGGLTVTQFNSIFNLMGREPIFPDPIY